MENLMREHLVLGFRKQTLHSFDSEEGRKKKKCKGERETRSATRKRKIHITPMFGHIVAHNTQSN
jgi:hypothetical protein